MLKRHSKKKLYKRLLVLTSVIGMSFIIFQALQYALDDYNASVVSETSISLAEIPSELLRKTRRAFGIRNIKEAEIITTENSVAYELDGEKNRRNLSVTVTEDGRPMEIGREVRLEDVPQDVMNTVRRDYPSFKIKDVELTQIVYYEIEGTINGISQTLLIRPNGAVQDRSGIGE